jgi:hypothetical protein
MVLASPSFFVYRQSIHIGAVFLLAVFRAVTIHRFQIALSNRAGERRAYRFGKASEIVHLVV